MRSSQVPCYIYIYSDGPLQGLFHLSHVDTYISCSCIIHDVYVYMHITYTCVRPPLKDPSDIHAHDACMYTYDIDVYI